MNTPMKTAIYWVEYIAKFNGAPHLRSNGIDLPFYKYYNLDCWAVILFVCGAIMFTILKLIMAIFKKFFSSLRLISSKKIKAKIN